MNFTILEISIVTFLLAISGAVSQFPVGKISDIYDRSNDCCIMIGPEGDFTIEEIDLAKKNNFKNITLGNSRLRTETAGVYAVSIVKILNEQ